jgi:hypothetical protein
MATSLESKGTERAAAGKSEAPISLESATGLFSCPFPAKGPFDAMRRGQVSWLAAFY